MHLSILCLAAGLAAAVAMPAEAACGVAGTQPVLTVAGQGLSAANRGALGPRDRFLAHQNLSFAQGRRFSAAELAALPQGTVEMVLPYDETAARFTGPTLASILAAAGAPNGAAVRIGGIDGYAVEYSAADIAALNPVLAQCRGDEPLGIGDLGPAFLVYQPKAARPNDDEFGRMVWGIYVIEVKP